MLSPAITDTAPRRYMRQVGEHVETQFDTGAFGAETLYGRVTKAGPVAYEVVWESGRTNRMRNDDRRVKSARNQSLAEEAMAMARARQATPTGRL